jgi:dCMP deaminase
MRWSDNDSQLLWEIKKATAMLKTIACLAHFNSKDPSSKVGAMIVRPDFSFVSQGYNGLPKGFTDTDKIWKNENPRHKYLYVQHAERNAIAFTKGVDATGCYVVCNLFPCHECAGLLVQAGITKVFYSASKREDHMCKVADEIFDNAKVHRIRIPGIVNLSNEPEFTSARWDNV